MKVGERLHRPDLIVIGQQLEAIEVELTPKAPRRLDKIVRGWARAVALGQYKRVRYLCSPRTLPLLERALMRTSAGEAVVAESRPVSGLDFAATTFP